MKTFFQYMLPYEIVMIIVGVILTIASIAAILKMITITGKKEHYYMKYLPPIVKTK